MENLYKQKSASYMKSLTYIYLLLIHCYLWHCILITLFLKNLLNQLLTCLELGSIYFLFAKLCCFQKTLDYDTTCIFFFFSFFFLIYVFYIFFFINIFFFFLIFFLLIYIFNIYMFIKFFFFIYLILYLTSVYNSTYLHTRFIFTTCT